MHQVPPLAPLVVLLAAAVSPAAWSLHLPTPSFDSPEADPPHRQHHWAYHAVSQPQVYEDSSIRRSDAERLDGSRLRHALQQLLNLNDGELHSLMAGASPQSVAPRIEPSTAFLLTGSRQYLERLSTILSTIDEDSPAKKSTWNPKIARRQSKKHFDSRSADEKGAIAVDDPDTILSALTELSQYLSGAVTQGQTQELEDDPHQDRKRRSHHHGGKAHKHQSLEKHGTTKFERLNYHYYLRTAECPTSMDGMRKMFCPTPYDNGEWECVDDLDLCDGEPQCPNEEDEAPTHCLFYNAMRTHVEALTEHILRSRFS